MKIRPSVVLTGTDLTIEDIIATGIGDKSVELEFDDLVAFRKLLFSSSLFDDLLAFIPCDSP